MYDEARRTLKPDRALTAKNALTEFVDWVVENGFSVHKISTGLSWVELEKQQRCIRSALLAVVSAQAFSIPVLHPEQQKDADWTVNIDWRLSELKAAGAFLEHLGVMNEHSIQTALRRINLSHAHLWDKNFSRGDFEGADFQHTSLFGVFSSDLA